MDTLDYKEYLSLNMDALSFIGHMVDNYGAVVGLEIDYSQEETLPRVHHDYVYFCVTKSIRSLLAAIELAKIRFREDVMTLVRSVYETYLLLGNAVNNREFTHKTVELSLGLRTKKYIHPRRGGGRLDYNKVKRKGYDKEIDFDMRKSLLARNTFCNIDRRIHADFYKYMSEYSHSDFISSGNYRTCNHTQYSIEPTDIYIDTIFVITYMTFLIIQSLDKYHAKFDELSWTSLHVEEVLEFNCILTRLKIHIIKLLDNMDFSGRKDGLKELFIERIEFKVSMDQVKQNGTH